MMPNQKSKPAKDKKLISELKKIKKDFKGNWISTIVSTFLVVFVLTILFNLSPDLQKLSPFKAEVWGTVSDWVMVLVTTITAIAIWRTFTSQKNVQDFQALQTSMLMEEHVINFSPEISLVSAKIESKNSHPEDEHAYYKLIVVLKVEGERPISVNLEEDDESERIAYNSKSGLIRVVYEISRLDIFRDINGTIVVNLIIKTFAMYQLKYSFNVKFSIDEYEHPTYNVDLTKKSGPNIINRPNIIKNHIKRIYDE